MNKHLYLERNAAKRRQMDEYLRQLKAKPCMDCGGTFHFSAMDFDHRPGTVKLYKASRAVAYRYLDEAARRNCQV